MSQNFVTCVLLRRLGRAHAVLDEAADVVDRLAVDRDVAGGGGLDDEIL